MIPCPRCGVDNDDSQHACWNCFAALDAERERLLRQRFAPSLKSPLQPAPVPSSPRVFLWLIGIILVFAAAILTGVLVYRWNHPSASPARNFSSASPRFKEFGGAWADEAKESPMTLFASPPRDANRTAKDAKNAI